MVTAISGLHCTTFVLLVVSYQFVGLSFVCGIFQGCVLMSFFKVFFWGLSGFWFLVSLPLCGQPEPGQSEPGQSEPGGMAIIKPMLVRGV
jgi:hypothetical protein